MNSFVIALGEQSAGAQKDIESSFPRNYPVVPGQVWVIASTERACVDICQKIGLQSGGPRNGVVVRFEDYNGLFARSLWEKINEWQQMPPPPPDA